MVEKERKSVKVTFVKCDDWEGLYVDGKLCAENHSLNNADVLKALGIKFDEFECDSAWIEERGSLPKDLKDVKRQRS